MYIDLTEQTDYIDKFTRVFSPAQQTEIMTLVGRKVGKEAVKYAAEYPEPSRKKLPKIYTRNMVAGKQVRPFLSKFKSDKQAYYVIFVLGKEGKIPYRRSGTLGKSMTHQISVVSANGVITEVGTNIPYAKRVIGGEGEQSLYHKGTWMTLPQIMTKNADKLKTVAVATYTAEIDKRMA